MPCQFVGVGVCAETAEKHLIAFVHDLRPEPDPVLRRQVSDAGWRQIPCRNQLVTGHHQSIPGGRTQGVPARGCPRQKPAASSASDPQLVPGSEHDLVGRGRLPDGGVGEVRIRIAPDDIFGSGLHAREAGLVKVVLEP